MIRPFNRRLALTAIAASSWFVQSAMASDALQNRPITIIYPYAAGSASDLLTRQVAEILSHALGNAVIVEAKPGAGGSTALEYVARAPADGHTLVLSASGTMAVNPHIYKLRYSPVDDLVPITVLTEIPFIAVTNVDFPAKNLKEFITLAKKQPGQITFANAGLGTQSHLTQMMFLKAAGIEANIVAYRGGTPMVTDLMGGHVDAAFDNAAAQMANVRANKVRALFVTSPTRLESMPQVPTAEEAGLPGFTASGWFGLAAPKGTPQAIIERMNQAISEAFKKPEMRRKLIDAGWVPVANSPAEAAARARADLARLGVTVHQLGIKPN